jgi:hypothetical protein
VWQILRELDCLEWTERNNELFSYGGRRTSNLLSTPLPQSLSFFAAGLGILECNAKANLLQMNAAWWEWGPEGGAELQEQANWLLAAVTNDVPVGRIQKTLWRGRKT